MFRPVTSRVNFPQVEESILSLWRQNHVFERSIEARQGARRFVLYEGPPTANGSPGIHHVLARVFKDVIPRYKVMKGYYAPRIAGWDTHGLPVELEVEKELGLSSKAQIEEYGVAEFNARCRESVFGYLKEWEAMTERIAFWIDLDNAYVTMRNEYIETVWWAIKQMWDRGLVYQGYKVTPHCPRCGTSLSSHEVALGYQDDSRGRRGQTLACLQYIVRIIVSHRTKRWSPIVIDVLGYKERRYQALQALAYRMAERVKVKRMPFALEPMSAYERRIVHLALADHPDVATQSVGEGEARKVVIVPKG